MKKYILLLAGLALLGNIVHAQETGRKHLALQGQVPVAVQEAHPSTYAERMDMNDDGKPEIVSVRENGQGTTTSLRILDSASRSTVVALTEARVVELFGVGQLRVLGFIDLDGGDTPALSVLKRSPETGKKAGSRNIYADYSGLPDAVQPGNDSLFVLNIAGPTLSIRQVFPGRYAGHTKATDIQSLSTFGLFDLDGDDRLDLFLGDDAAGVVEIWGVTPDETTAHENGRVDESGLLSGGARLFQNFPNPFAGNTAITYQVSENDLVRLRIYDLLGREVRSLIDASQTPGVHTVQWDGRDEGGDVVAAGVYLYKLQIGDFTATRQMIRVK